MLIFYNKPYYVLNEKKYELFSNNSPWEPPQYETERTKKKKLKIIQKPLKKKIDNAYVSIN